MTTHVKTEVVNAACLAYGPTAFPRRIRSALETHMAYIEKEYVLVPKTADPELLKLIEEEMK